jgi:hypothetical protein
MKMTGAELVAFASGLGLIYIVQHLIFKEESL